jgi:hypothetical protein
MLCCFLAYSSRLIRSSSSTISQLQKKLLSSTSSATQIEKSATYFSDGTISIRNTQRKYRVDLENICRDIQMIKSILKIEDFQLDVLICSDSKMRALNSDWRGISSSTGIKT